MSAQIEDDEDIRGSFLGIKSSEELIANQREQGLGKQVKRTLADLFYGPLHQRVLYAMLVALLLGLMSCHKQCPHKANEIIDLCVYSIIYGAWFVFCAPMLLMTINLHLALQVLQTMCRLFLAEITAMAYAYHRGHNNILRPGIGLFPTLEANRSGQGLAWLGEAGYNLRLASLLSCCLITVIASCLDMCWEPSGVA